MNENKKNLKSVVFWIYIILLIIQIFTTVVGITIRNSFFELEMLQYLNFIADIGEIFFINNLSFSLVIIAIFFIDILTQQLQFKSKKKFNFTNFILLFSNLYISNQLYQFENFSRLAVNIKEHWLGILIFFIICFGMIFIGEVINNIKNAKEENKTSFYLNDNDETNNQKDNNSYLDERNFAIKHPISYVWSNYKNYYTTTKKEKQKIKTDFLIKKQEKYYAEKLKDENYTPAIEQIVILIIFVLIDILIVCAIQYIASINLNLEEIQEWLDKTENPLINLLLSLGVVVLLSIAIILINYLLYFTFNTILKFIASGAQDKKHIEKFSYKIKTFFLYTLDTIVYFLMFLPEFLNVIEDFLFEIDVDELVREKFPEYDKIDKKNSKDS